MITVENIQKAVSRHFGISLVELRGPGRKADISQPRQLAMYLCRKMTRLSLPHIGRRFNYRDHTTILHGCRAIIKRLPRDNVLAEDLALISKKLDRLERIKPFLQNREVAAEARIVARKERALNQKIKLSTRPHSDPPMTLDVAGQKYRLIPYAGMDRGF